MVTGLSRMSFQMQIREFIREDYYQTEGDLPNHDLFRQNMSTTRSTTLVSHELRVLEEDRVHSTEDREQEVTDNRLKPVDGGLAAWRVLLAAFMCEAILWGE
jgi:hypothetical protein